MSVGAGLDLARRTAGSIAERENLTPVLWPPVYDVALVVIAVSMLMAMVRLLRGPTLADRVVALDLLSFFAAGAICVIAMDSDRPELLMVAVIVALLTFMSTAAFALYLERHGRERRRTGDADAR